MASITTRAGKGSPLTNAEVDANFTNLNTELGQKIESSALSPYLLSATAASTYQTISGMSAYLTTTSAASTYLTQANAASTYQPLDGDLTSIAGLSGTSGILRKTAANTFTLDTATYLTGNQSISVSGDASGSGTTSIALTLANSGVTAGTYTKVTVDAKGRVTVGASLASADLPTYTGTLTSSQITTALGYTPVNKAGDTITGRLGIGSGSVTSDALRVVRNIDGATSANGVLIDGSVQSDVTTRASYFRTVSNTQATAFTLASLIHYEAAQNATFGAGSAVTTQVGFRADATMVGASTNIGFRGSIPTGTNRWNLFMDGTASNHLAGPLAINTTFLNDYLLRVGGNMSGAATRGAVEVNSTAQSDVTSEARGVVSSVSTAASAFTVGQASAFLAAQGTVGAGSAITTQVGFLVGSGFTGGATNNYGFRGAIPSGTGRWNLFMDGTAANFLGGNLIVNGSLGFGTSGSPSYGASGQFLKSAGNAAAPTWGSLTSSEVTTALGFTPISGNQTITLSGDASGSGSTSISVTLANSGVTAGTYTKVTVDAKGRVTSGTTLASADLPTYTGSLTSTQVTNALGYTPYNSSNPSGYITNTGNARVGVENNGTLVGTRRNINFIPGTGISLSITDDSANEEVDVTITSTASGGVTSFNTRTGAVTLSSSDVTTALGFTPYNSTNPSGYTSNTGTVTSVSGTGSVSGLSLSGTVTTSGNLTLSGTLSVTASNFASQTANTFLAAPNGTAGVPTFRAIAAADIPTLNQNTTGTASNVTGTVAVANGGTGAGSASGARTNLGATTVGANFFTLSNPSAVRFPRINADNTVSALTSAELATAVGAATTGKAIAMAIVFGG